MRGTVEFIIFWQEGAHESLLPHMIPIRDEIKNAAQELFRVKLIDFVCGVSLC